MQSYGLAADATPQKIVEAMPPEHLQFLKTLERYVVIGNYVIVHAGLNPLRELTDQVDEELYWIRDEFMMNRHFFEKTIVFGHTPHKEVFYDLPYKIGIDTGLVYGNKLTCLELVNFRLIQIKHGGQKVKACKAKVGPRQRLVVSRRDVL